MPIQPFVDRDKFQFKRSRTVSPNKNSSTARPNIDRFRQGVSLRNSIDVFGDRLLPFVGSKRLPDYVQQKIDFSIEKTTYGDVQISLRSNDGKKSTPFHDIDSLKNPVNFINDPGITAYPQIMLSQLQKKKELIQEK